MRVLPLLIVLALPALELAVGVRLARELGWWLLAWLALAALAGAALVREAGHGLEIRLMRALMSGESILTGVLESGRTMLAGLFLIFPGVITDVIAFALLLLPFRAPLAPGGR